MTTFSRLSSLVSRGMRAGRSRLPAFRDGGETDTRRRRPGAAGSTAIADIPNQPDSWRSLGNLAKRLKLATCSRRPIPGPAQNNQRNVHHNECTTLLDPGLLQAPDLLEDLLQRRPVGGAIIEPSRHFGDSSQRRFIDLDGQVHIHLAIVGIIHREAGRAAAADAYGIDLHSRVRRSPQRPRGWISPLLLTPSVTRITTLLFALLSRRRFRQVASAFPMAVPSRWCRVQSSRRHSAGRRNPSVSGQRVNDFPAKTTSPTRSCLSPSKNERTTNLATVDDCAE